ncbi:MAG: hypothetical protein Q7S27_07245 [Nanoarchaeota archaeon]|nr:hypothetical protein [Nanoarchaeota archaeon]
MEFELYAFLLQQGFITASGFVFRRQRYKMGIEDKYGIDFRDYETLRKEYNRQLSEYTERVRKNEPCLEKLIEEFKDFKKGEEI